MESVRVRKRQGRADGSVGREEVTGMLLPVTSPVKGRKTPAKRVGTEAAAVDGAGRKRQWKHREATREEVGTSARARAAFEAHEAYAAWETQETQGTLAKAPLKESSGLKSIFAGLVSVYTMMKRRNKQITFSSVKDAVEQASRRRFGIADLRELARVAPEMLQLEERERTTKSLEDAVIRVCLPKGGAGVAMEAFGVALDQATAAVVVATPRDGGVGITNRDRDRDGDGEGSQTPDSSAKRLKANPRMRSVLQSPTSRRLSELVEVCGDLGDRGSGHQTRHQTRHRNLNQSTLGLVRTPMAPIPAVADIEENKDLYARTLSGVISMSSLQQLAQNEQRHVALSSTEARAARHERAIMASLPDTLQRVLAVFGRKGARCMGLGVVCERVRGGGLETVRLEDVEGRVRALAAHAAEFLTIEKGRGGVEEVFVQTKGFDVNACMAKLKKLV